MEISKEGIEALEEHEGFRAEAYLDTGGVWTIGFGTTRVDGKPVVEGMKCTRDQAVAWRTADMKPAVDCVNKMGIELTQNQFDALVSFVYNIGVGAFNASTMRRLLIAKDFEGAAKQFDRWIYDNGKVIRGLVARRRCERALFEKK